jgi:hypothetical protein
MHFVPSTRSRWSNKLQNALRAETNFINLFNVIYVVQFGR